MAGHAGYNLTSSDGTTAQFRLGDIINVCGATYMYLIADGAITAYSACSIQNDFDAQMATSALSGAKPTAFAIPQFAVADNEYFWAPVGPFFLREDGVTTFKVNALASCAGSVKLYTTTTDGSVDDATGAGQDLIAGLCLTETITTAESADCIAVQRLVSNCQD